MANENAPAPVVKRRTPKSVILALIGLGFVLGVIGLLFSPDGSGPAEPLIGAEAPDFEFTILPGEQKYTLASFRGKVVLLNFWAYWCEPCREEMPSLKKLEAHFPNDFVLLMLHVGDEKDEALKIPDLPSKLVMDVDVGALTSYGVSGLPHSFLIDKQGIVRAHFKGPQDWMSEKILEQIREPVG